MPAYSFKERFIPLIKSRKKRQTIRKKRKGQAKKGDTLYLYYGMRTKYCTKIMETTCRDTKEIEIKENGVILIDGRKLSDSEKNDLAVADGFLPEKQHGLTAFEVMLRWWKQTHELPFIGDIIYW